MSVIEFLVSVEDSPLAPSSKKIDWMAGLRKGHTWKGSFRAGKVAHRLPGSLTSDAGLPNLVIWQMKNILPIMEEGFDVIRLEAHVDLSTLVEQGSLSAAARR